MKELLTNKYFILLLVITLFLLFMVALFTVDRQSVTFGEDLAATVITPFQSLFTSASSGISGFFGYFANMDKIKFENAALSDEVNSLGNTVRQLEQYKLENERLRSLLGLKERMADYTFVCAEVIAKDTGNWYSSFTINKGTMDGLAVRQAVITSGGLVGHIYEIGTGYAKVLAIIDANSSAGAIVARTRDVAIVESDVTLGQQGLCKMTHIGKSASIIPGDLIETSGLGGVYPKGLLIGKVREIKPENAAMSQYAVVEPSVDFERISEVFVITNYPAE